MKVDDATNPNTPGRVVMLVDNGVDGDSRVQKAARSAAEAGWDVTLLGCSTTGVEREWLLGPARVRLLPMGGGQPSQGRGLRARLVARGGLPLRAARLARRPVEHAQVRFWRLVRGDGAWRRLEPGLWNYERVFGPVIDELAPDLIHAHDFRMLGVGARAAERGRAAGRPIKLLWDAHEFLPGAKPRRDNARWLPAHLAYEREYVPYADAVVTVSDTLAELLRTEHHLAELPAVVLNAPAATPAGPVPDLRALCGLDSATPLLVYGGSATVQRGLGTVVEALPRLTGVHLALVVNDPANHYVRQLLATAARLGVADRVHAVPYVQHGQVSAFLATADIGVIPIHHWPNHEIALITKFFEYSHAHLPIVVSDVKTMAETVRATGQGEVFRAQDPADFVRAVRAVLANPHRYRAVYDKPDGPLAGWTWEAQAARLDSIYRRLLSVEVGAR
ncbi:MAG TPA: glycosyltransferase family 4 protein [Asanoa sp.]|nr:glycosyltransferase family 4 protein [Asanoa sp.]